MKAVWREWAERAEQHAAPGTSDRAYANVALARAAVAAGEYAHGVELLDQALALARQLDDPELLFTCTWQSIRIELTPQHWRRLEPLAREALVWPREGVSSRTIGQVLEFGGAALLFAGDREGAERAWSELSQLAGRTQDASTQINAISYEGLLATLDGRLEAAAEIAERVVARGEEVGAPRAGMGAAWSRCGRALLFLGRVERARALYRPMGGFGASDSLLLAYAGEHARAREVIAAWLAAHPGEQGTPPVTFTFEIIQQLEAALVIGDRDTVALLASWIVDPPAVNALQSASGPLRHLGDAAALLGDRAQARDCYEQALMAAAQVRFRPEIALTRLALAELLLTGSPEEVAEAQPHLDFAIEELRAMKMQPDLERALRPKGMLEA